MVSRIEVVLFLLLLLFAGIGVSTHMEAVRASKMAKEERKKVMIVAGHLREINATGLENDYRSDRAWLKGEVWYFENFLLRNREIRRLQSEHARKEKTGITLEGNVTLDRMDDSRFRAEKIVYDDHSRILQSVGPFYGEKGESFVRGSDLYYDLTRKVTRARKVFAHYILGQKLEKSTVVR